MKAILLSFFLVGFVLTAQTALATNEVSQANIGCAGSKCYRGWQQ